MATMTFQEIFTAYYSQFRADSDIPTATDTEYIVGMRMANEAINRWKNYDGTLWNELWTTNQLSNNAGQVVVPGQTVYDLPTDFNRMGGYITLRDADGTRQSRIPLIDNNQGQFRIDEAQYAYIAGGKLILNPIPNSDNAGKIIDFDYYKEPTLFTSPTSVTEMSDPYFIVHRMLANQFRASRNPYYSSAKQDAEDVLRTMQLKNNSGTWGNPPVDIDNSGTEWGW